MARSSGRLARGAVVVLGLILIGVLMLHLPPVRARVLDRVRSYAAEHLRIALQASSLRYGLLTRTIELRNISLASTTGSPAFLEADRAVVLLDPAIYFGRPSVARISIERPRLTLMRDRDGLVNLPAAAAHDQSSRPLQFGLVSLRGLSLTLDDRAAQRSFTLGPFDLSLDTRDATAPPAPFGPGGFSFRVGETAVSGTVEGRLAFDGTRVRIEGFTAQTPQGRLEIGGWADVIGEPPAISAHINATIDAAEAARLARVDARGLAGRLEATVDLSGGLTAPAARFTILSRDAAYPPLGGVGVEGGGSLNGTRALIEGLDVHTAAGSLHVEGAVELAPANDSAATSSHLALRWANVRVDDLARAFGRPLTPGTGSLAAGSGNVDFDARDLSVRALSRIRAAADTAFHRITSAPGGDSLALAGTAALQLDQGRWSLRHSVRTAMARASLAGTVTGRVLGTDRFGSTIGGGSQMRVDDVAGVPRLLQASGIRVPPDASDGLAGSMQATLNLAGTLDRLRAQIDLAARDLRTRMLSQAATLDIRLDVDTDGLRVQQATALAGSTSFQAAGRYLWRGPFDAHFEASHVDLSDIARQTTSPVEVRGTARIEGAISGALTNHTRSGQARFTLSAADVAIDQIAIGDFAAIGTVALADGGPIAVDAVAPGAGARVKLEILNRPGYPVSGDVSLEHHDIATLIPPRYRDQIGELSGSVSASARGAGRLSEPAGIRGRVDLRAFDVIARGTRLMLTAPGSLTLAEDRIAAEPIGVLLGRHTRATLRGQLGVSPLPDPLQVHLDGPLSELLEIGARAGDSMPPSIQSDGTATLDLTIAGTIGRPRPGGTLAVRSPSLTYGTLAPVTRLAVDAAIDPTLITLRAVTAEWQDMSLTADGTLPWRVVLSSVPVVPGSTTSPASSLAGWLNAMPAEPSRARVAIRAANLTQAMLKDAVTPQRLRDIQGTASATVVAEADRMSLDRVQATAVLDRASLTLAGVPFTQSVPTRLRLENGRILVEDFQWTAEGNSIVASGAADLSSPRPSIDLGVAGAIDLRVLSAFVSGVTSGGSARVNLKVTGPFDEPNIVGEVGVADTELQLDPRLAATDFQGTLAIGDRRKLTVSLAGLLNTGSAQIAGTIDLADLSSPLGTLQFTGRNVALEYPSGLQTESNLDLEVAFGPTSTLSGRIEVLGGTYLEPLVLSSQLLNLSSPSGIVRTVPPPDWLSRIRLNVAIATATDLRIDNNYGRLDVGAALRLVGTAAHPGVLGRLQAADDGEIFLGGTTYRIEQLTIDLTNPRAITPAVNFSAQTRVGSLPIGIDLRCPAAAPCERKVTSLAAGVDDKEAEAQLFGTAGGAASAGENLARLLSGELLGVVGHTVGLDAIRLEQQAERRDIFDDPTLISGDVDPAARLTLAKRLGSNVELVFSQNLAEEGFTWITSYFGPFGLSWRLLVLDDQSRSYEFRHEPRIGGRTRQRARLPAPRIAAVRIEGTPGFPENELRSKLQLAEGDRFSFGTWQRDRDRLERFYHAQGLLESRIRARRLPLESAGREGAAPEDRVVLEYRITRGPTTQLDVRGITLPNEVRNRIVGRWASALFDDFLERDARAIVREHCYRQGHLDATVTATVAAERARDLKTLTIDVVPGASVSGRIEVNGNTAVPAATLLELASGTDPFAAWLDPQSVERVLESHYRAEGFLASDVSVGAADMRSGASVVPIQVVEGTAFAIGTVVVSGLPQGSEQQARDALALSTGGRYRPADVAAGVDRLELQLRRAAYRTASTEVEIRTDDKAAQVDVTVRVTPGPRSILRDVVVAAADSTKPAIAGAITLTPDAPLDPVSIRETRRRLYDLDVYRSVDVQVHPLSSDPPLSSTAPAELPVRATITLEERPRYRVRYGVAVSDEEIGTDERDRRLGFAADVENRNVFGRAATAGVSLRLRRDQQVGRVTLGSRRFFGLPLRSTVFVERQRAQIDPEGAFPITSDVTAVTAEQAYRLRRAIEFRYGYQIERNHTFIRGEPPDPFDLTVTVARLTTSGLVDRRNDAFNPLRGWFASSALELSKPGLGSDLSFLRNFAQYSHFVGVGRGIVLATGARLGLARTIDDEVLIPTERFYAGGANTVRGYREDDLGPRSVFDDADGGEAMLVLNGELRFPIHRWLKGVGFVDLGNVYPKARDFSFTDLQIGVGAGARFDTPFGLIRFDLGIPANPRSFDPKWRVHVGLGHAF